MKQITITPKLLVESGAPIQIYKDDEINDIDLVYTFEISTNREGDLVAYKRGVPLAVTPGNDFQPTAVLAGFATNFKSVSNDMTTFGLAVYDQNADNKSLWFNCRALGKTGQILSQYANKANVAVSGNFELVQHETFGTQLKLFVNNFSLLGGAKKEEKAVESSATNPIPF